MKKHESQSSPSNSAALQGSRTQVVAISGAITVVVAYQLYCTAAVTGNYEGFWFSLAHTVLVAVAVVCALGPSRSKQQGPVNY